MNLAHKAGADDKETKGTKRELQSGHGNSGSWTPEREEIRIAMRMPWQRAPEPEPEPSEEWWLGGPGFTLGALILWLFYTRTCIALQRGQLGPVEPKHAKYTFWCVPLAVLVHGISFLSGNMGVGEVGFLTGLPGKVLDRPLLLYLGATAR